MANQSNSNKDRKYDRIGAPTDIQTASVASVALELGISKGIIYTWKQDNEQQNNSRWLHLSGKIRNYDSN